MKIRNSSYHQIFFLSLIITESDIIVLLLFSYHSAAEDRQGEHRGPSETDQEQNRPAGVPRIWCATAKDGLAQKQ